MGPLNTCRSSFRVSFLRARSSAEPRIAQLGVDILDGTRILTGFRMHMLRLFGMQRQSGQQMLARSTRVMVVVI